MKRTPAAAAKPDGSTRQDTEPEECPEWEEVAASLKRPRPRKVIANKFLTFLFRPQAETEIARIPEQIKGYGHVKERNLAAARAQWARLILQWSSPQPDLRAA